MNRSATPATSPLRILVADEDAAARTQLMLCLEADGHHTVGHGNIYDALAEASWQAFDLVFVDPHAGNGHGPANAEALARLREECPGTRVILLGASAIAGADSLPKPLLPAQAQSLARGVAEFRLLQRKIGALQQALDAMDPEADLPTASPAMQRALQLARTAANSSAAVLIRGEVGTGKGRLARAIHGWSARANAPFARVGCHLDSADSLGAELFGLCSRENGAGSAGSVEQCEGGTLVIDGVSDMPMELQVKLLRLMREREYERHDDFRPRPANVRVIATTHVDLESLAQRGRFRADLLAALETVRIDLPPLRHRAEDIPRLAERYAAHFARATHRPPPAVSPQVMQVLCEHRWPANVRELRNVIERAVLLCKSDTIGLDCLPANLLNSPVLHAVGDLVPLEVIEQLHIRKVVDSMPTITSAAAVLGVHPGTVLRRLKKTASPPADAAATADGQTPVAPA
jgi:NtrC-family two-component system response regulator AlgB